VSKSKVVFGAWLLIWIFVTTLGIKLYLSVVEQRVPGYPNSGQFDVYVLFPGIAAALNLLVIIFSKKIHLGILVILFFVECLALLTFFFIGSGGV
jgi:hypothetical protein